jgi:hypothetical protein
MFVPPADEPVTPDAPRTPDDGLGAGGAMP